MFGQLAPLGTGSFKLLLNREEVKLAKYVPDLHINIQGDNDLINMMEFDDVEEVHLLIKSYYL